MRVIEIRLADGTVLAASAEQRLLGARAHIGIDWFTSGRFNIGDYVAGGILPLKLLALPEELPDTIKDMSRVVGILVHEKQPAPIEVPEKVLDEVRSV